MSSTSPKLIVQINEPETPWRPVGRYEDGPPQKGMVGDCAWMWYVDGSYWELVLQPHTDKTHLAPLPTDYNTWEYPHVSVPYHLDLNNKELVESLVPGYCHICHELAGDTIFQCKGRHVFCSDIDLCRSCCESAFDFLCPDCNQEMDPVSFPFATDVDSEPESENE